LYIAILLYTATFYGEKMSQGAMIIKGDDNEIQSITNTLFFISK